MGAPRAEIAALLQPWESRDTAKVIGISTATADPEWTPAKAWLYVEPGLPAP